MIIVSSREFREKQATLFETVKQERVIIRRKNQYYELKSLDENMTDKESLSPSGDTYFDNPRNVSDIIRGKQQIREGKSVNLTEDLRKELFGDGI